MGESVQRGILTDLKWWNKALDGENVRYMLGLEISCGSDRHYRYSGQIGMLGLGASVGAWQ